jgi:hypothetical protein
MPLAVEPHAAVGSLNRSCSARSRDAERLACGVRGQARGVPHETTAAMRPFSPRRCPQGMEAADQAPLVAPALGAAPAGEGTTLERAPDLAAQADDAEGRRPGTREATARRQGRAGAIFAGSAARQRHRSTWTMALHSATDATVDLLWRTGLFGSLGEADDCRPFEGQHCPDHARGHGRDRTGRRKAAVQ